MWTHKGRCKGPPITSVWNLTYQNYWWCLFALLCERSLLRGCWAELGMRRYGSLAFSSLHLFGGRRSWMDWCHFFLKTQWPGLGKLIKLLLAIWTFNICSSTHLVLGFIYLFIYFVLLAFLGFPGEHLSDWWISLLGLPLLCTSASPPSSGKKKMRGWWRPTFTAASFKVCSSDLPLVIVTIRFYDACLSKITGHYCIFLYTEFMLCFLYLCTEVFLFGL